MHFLLPENKEKTKQNSCCDDVAKQHGIMGVIVDDYLSEVTQAEMLTQMR